MSRESYERLKGITFGVALTFKEVAQPWLETGKRALEAGEAEFVCAVCHHHCLLAHDGFRDQAKMFADLLRDHPEEVGTLIVLIGKWRAKRSKSKSGRARTAIEIAYARHPDKPLSNQLVCEVAAAEGINLLDVSQEYIRGRLNDIRREVEDDRARLATPEARKAADEWADARIAARAKFEAAAIVAPAKRSKQIRKVNAR
jgi:hypothetical protein